MSVLVTGGAGFIGSNLTRALLARGERVICLDDFNDYYAPARKRHNVQPFLAHPAYTLVEGDIRREDDVTALFARHRPTRVAHLAAMAGIPPSVRDPIRYEEVNITGTIRLLNAAAEHGCAIFLLASSSSVYGATSAVPFQEDAAADRPLAPYPATKRAAEMMAHAYHHLHGLPVMVTRFFNAYGPGVRPDLATYIFTRAIHRGEPICLYGNVRRDYTYVDDTVNGILAALDWRGGYEVVNLGHAEPVTMTDLIAAIARTVGRPAHIEKHAGLPADAPATWADLTKARRLLGYDPTTPLETGLAHLYDWFLEQERLGIA